MPPKPSQTKPPHVPSEEETTSSSSPGVDAINAQLTAILEKMGRMEVQMQAIQGVQGNLVANVSTLQEQVQIVQEEVRSTTHQPSRPRNERQL